MFAIQGEAACKHVAPLADIVKVTRALLSVDIMAHGYQGRPYAKRLSAHSRASD